MMLTARTPTLDRPVRSDEIERGRWLRTHWAPNQEGSNAARRDSGGEAGITALERLAREQRWACEWWPPE
jgi:hypothetical protein